jgi:hypothetical protein
MQTGSRARRHCLLRATFWLLDLLLDPEDGGSEFLRNDCKSSHPRRFPTVSFFFFLLSYVYSHATMSWVSYDITMTVTRMRDSRRSVWKNEHSVQVSTGDTCLPAFLKLAYAGTFLSVYPHINFWIPKPIFMKLGMYVMAPEPISMAYFTNPSHQSVCLCIPRMVARKRLGKFYPSLRF